VCTSIECCLGKSPVTFGHGKENDVARLDCGNLRSRTRRRAQRVDDSRQALGIGVDDNDLFLKPVGQRGREELATRSGADCTGADDDVFHLAKIRIRQLAPSPALSGDVVAPAQAQRGGGDTGKRNGQPGPARRSH